MRAAPRAQPAPLTRKSEWMIDVHVVLITRLFGGGAKTREIDKISWLRSSAAKSALRAWWRAGNAHKFSSLEELRERETELFGSSASYNKDGEILGGPGAVEVTAQSKLAAPPTDYNEPFSNSLNYALFPAQGRGLQPAAKVVAASDQSWATVHLKSSSTERVDHATLIGSLSLWLVLGGVGARSRRGAGALAVSSPAEAKKLGLPVSLEDLKSFLREHCKPRPVAGSLEGTFCLARTRKVFLGPVQPTGEAAQKELLSILRKARQDRPNSSRTSPGRSGWPEADAVRLKSHPAASWGHKPDPANAEQYPRAVLGLPIVMHFKTPPVEPADHHVLGALHDGREWNKLERYSSPIILRPIRVWEGDRAQYVPVAVFTDCTLPQDTRALVTSTPKDKAKPADVVSSYRILQDADATLRRIETVFASTPGFHSL
jgi:CRISPR-associated protein Cmr1